MDSDSRMLSPSIELAFFGGTIMASYRTPGDSHVVQTSSFQKLELKIGTGRK